MKDRKKLKAAFIKELYEKYDCGIAEFLMRVNKNNLSKPAIFYRGRTITFQEMFDHAIEYAASMKEMGIEKGMEIPICMSNTPELVYTILAASIIGARINIFGNVFDKDYIRKIINDTDAKVLFVTDDMYLELQSIIPNTNVKKTVMFSITDSFINGVNPYAELEKDYYDGESRVPKFKEGDPSILDAKEFVGTGLDHPVPPVQNDRYDEWYENAQSFTVRTNLDDKFSTTYSSGSTNSDTPKDIMHSNRSFNAMGMAHFGYDTPTVHDLRVLVHIPTHSNTCIISSIFDTLAQGCCCAMEYIYDENFFARSLLINKPNEVFATRSFWIQGFKDLVVNKLYGKNVKLPFLAIPMSIGEPTSPGEEKFFNKCLRKLRAGTDIVPLPISPITMTLAGGDCEHGGIFFNLFKALREKDPRRLFRKEPIGYSTYRMVDYAVLDEDGNHCAPYEPGVLVANSPTNMLGYKSFPEENQKFWVRDSAGNVWGTCNTYSYIDREGGVHIKGRIPDKDCELPLYLLQDEVLKDTKNILSCEVVELEDGIFVIHLERQPDSKMPYPHLLCSVEARLNKAFPASIVDRIVYTLHDDEARFPKTACGKRSTPKLTDMGLKNSYKIFDEIDIIKAIEGEAWVSALRTSKKIKMDKLD